MSDIDDIITGITLAIEHSSDWLSIWEFDLRDQSVQAIYTNSQLEHRDEYREHQPALKADVEKLIAQSGRAHYRQGEDSIEKNFGEVYVESIHPIDSSHYYLVKFNRVSFPFEMEHRARSKKVSDLEKQISRNIIHELLTPVNSIQGLNEQLSETLLDKNTKSLLDLHADSCSQLKTHISDIVNSIGLRTSEARCYTQEDFDLLDTVFSVSSKANRSILENGRRLAFKLNYPTQLSSLPVKGYPTLLEQTLLQLIDNAIKFTPDEGSIRVDLEWQDNNSLFFSIADTGCGIAPELSRLIFRPFVLGDMRDTRIQKGLGLGLSAALDCLIIMTGNVNAKIHLDTAIDEGSTFSFSLPYEKSNIEVTDREGSLQLPNPPESYCILVAEDNPTQQMIISRLIKKLGFEYKLVGNGIEAVGEFIRGDTHYDLVLMDIQMPGISGHEATKLIRKHEQELKLNKTPIIAITANIENEVHGESLKAGMDGHYGKPVTRVVLDDLIRKSILGISL